MKGDEKRTNEGNGMRLTLSLAKEEIEKLKRISKEEQRPFSRQVVFMMECYLKTKEKNKDLER